jgi:hypothetical protein
MDMKRSTVSGKIVGAEETHSKLCAQLTNNVVSSTSS